MFGDKSNKKIYCASYLSYLQLQISHNCEKKSELREINLFCFFSELRELKIAREKIIRHSQLKIIATDFFRAVASV